MWSTTSAMFHFPSMGRWRASDALTWATAFSSSCAAARILSRIPAAVISAARVFKYSSMRTDSGASGNPSTSRIWSMIRLTRASTDWLSLADDSLADGVQNQLRDAVQVQLLQDMGPVRLHRVQTQVQEIRNIFV